MRQRLQSASGKALYKLRQETVEPVFGIRFPSVNSSPLAGARQFMVSRANIKNPVMTNGPGACMPIAVAEWEQYRYVAMKLGDDHPIDWSHEREWRWADVEDKFGCPGLPVWLQNGSVLFTQAIIVVRTCNEAEQVMDKLKLMRDSKTDQYDNPYVRAVILGTRVLAVEDALGAADEPGHRLLRIDDVPVHQLKEAVAAVPSEAVMVRVANAINGLALPVLPNDSPQVALGFCSALYAQAACRHRPAWIPNERSAELTRAG